MRSLRVAVVLAAAVTPALLTSGRGACVLVTADDRTCGVRRA
jgi:hypothetical protein